MGNIHFPNLPKSIWAVAVPWAITLAMLYFETSLFGFEAGGGYYGPTATNPVLLMGFPILISIVFMPKDSFETVKQVLGFAIPATKGKLMAASSIVTGLAAGYFLYFFITRATGIIPLYIFPVSTLVYSQLSLIAIAMLYAMVAIGEEVMCILWAKNSANWLGDRFGAGLGMALVGGHIIGRMFWASLHYFSYQAYLTGLNSIPLFMWAWSMGMVFVGLAFGFGRARDVLMGEGSRFTYMIYPAIMAHWMFDVSITIQLMTLPV